MTDMNITVAVQSPKYPIGTRFFKKFVGFGAGMWEGKITSFDGEDYEVEYVEDKLIEYISEKDIDKIMVRSDKLRQKNVKVETCDVKIEPAQSNLFSSEESNQLRSSNKRRRKSTERYVPPSVTPDIIRSVGVKQETDIKNSKQEDDEQTVVSMMKTPPGDEISSIQKPLFERGDRVYAAWLPVNTKRSDRDTSGGCSGQWFPGKIRSYKRVDSKSRYGETRTYHIDFDDGDEGYAEDFFVMRHEDYELNLRGVAKWKGVKPVKDPNTSDQWAKLVGWYKVNIGDGEEKLFSTLLEAMQAYDNSVIQQKGAKTKPSELNLPETLKNLPKQETSVNAATPISLPSLSSSREDDDDEMSRFSGREEDEKRSVFQIQIEKSDIMKIQLPPTLEGDEDDEGLWMKTEECVEFTEEAFMNNLIFHLNSFVNAGDRKNMGFEDLIKGGFASACSSPIPEAVAPHINEMAQNQLRLAILQQNEWTCNHDRNHEARASQVAMWLKRIDIGSFIVMRHEYGNCDYCPNWLKRRDGRGNVKYIGPVYVIGVVTKKIMPCSEEENLAIGQMKGKLKGIPQRCQPVHNLCLVDWKRIGYKQDLKQETQTYLNRICQPTVVNICADSEKVYKDGATSDSIRRDLFINSSPLDFVY